MIAANRRAEIEKIVRGMHHEIIQGAKLRYRCGLPPYPQLFSPDVAIVRGSRIHAGRPYRSPVSDCRNDRH
jgi:hypothetical protein